MNTVSSANICHTSIKVPKAAMCIVAIHPSQNVRTPPTYRRSQKLGNNQVITKSSTSLDHLLFERVENPEQSRVLLGQSQWGFMQNFIALNILM
jgi:hypothetical protein